MISSLLVMLLLVTGVIVYVVGESGSCLRAESDALAAQGNTKEADGVLSIGALLPQTGSLAHMGPRMSAGMQLAIKDITDSGGVPGIEMLPQINVRDSGDASTDLASQSTDVLLSSGIDVIIGAAASQVSLSVIDRIVCAGVIMFSPTNTSPVFSEYHDYGFYFRTAPSDLLQGRVLGRLVVNDGNRTAIVMSRDDAYGNGLREATAKAIKDSGGRVLASFSYDPDAQSYDREVQQVVSANPDAVVMIGFNEDAQILSTMIKQGVGPVNKNIYITGNMNNTLIGQVNPRDHSVLRGMKGTALSRGDEHFLVRLKQFSPSLQDCSCAAHAYDTVVIVALAAAIASTDAPAAVAKEINGVTKGGERCTSFADCVRLVKEGKNIDYDGVSGPLEFTDVGEPSMGNYAFFEAQPDGSLKHLRDERIRF